VDRLRVSPAEAKGRVARALDLGPRQTLTGAPLDPILPQVSAAHRDGDLCVEQVRVITHCLDRIPTAAGAAVLVEAERFLVDQAGHVDARTLAAIAHRLLATLDPDGTAPREDEAQRRREFSIARRTNGTFVLRGELTAEFVATWNPILDTLAAPIPSEDGLGDDRTAAQRRHDAILEAGQRLLRSGTLPDCGGVPATIVVQISEAQLRQRSGIALTDHDDPLPVTAVLDLAAEADIIPVVLNQAGGVLAYGRTRRIATPGQRRALLARDGGCCFPGCSRPASWCQANHVTRWEHGGPTDIENLCLLCRYHHREFERRGWVVRMRDGTTEWTPPALVDPERQPVRNTAHHLPDFTFTS
jgi:hypothetical protein